MPTQPSQRLPKFRIHKATGYAYVELCGKRTYLGRQDTPESQQRYHAMVAEWLAAGRQPRIDPQEITVKELIARYWVFAEQYYRTPLGGIGKEAKTIRSALRYLKELYGLRRAVDFGPVALRAVRQKMIDNVLCRSTVNMQVNRIKRVFKWAASEELIPGQVYHSLQAVSGLRSGHTDARESVPTRPVPQEQIDAIESVVSRQVWAMVRLQLLTGARPGELVIMRPSDVDATSAIWTYTPARHKTAHHGHERRIFLGPQAQAILRPFLLRPAEVGCFSPAEAESQRRAAAHSRRKTPLSCGNRPGTNRSSNPRRPARSAYSVDAYRRAIARACNRIGVPPWHPHQLRHNAATNLRREFGIEIARIILGHRSAAITTIYAEADQQKAIEAMSRVG